MECTLDKYTSYEVKDVVHDGGRNVVHLVNPPASCPDGTLNSSHTIVRENADVQMPTLSFSTKLGKPVVLLPHSSHVIERVDPTVVPETSSHWFLWLLLLIGVVCLVRWLIKKGNQIDAEAKAGSKTEPAFSGSSTASSPGYYWKRRPTAPAPAPAPTSPAGHQTTVINNSGGGAGDLALGMVIGSSLNKERVVERETIIERQPSYGSDSPSSFGNDDGGSSYGGDSGGSSYGGDSDGGSSFGGDSDGGGSFGGDGGGSFGGD